MLVISVATITHCSGGWWCGVLLLLVLYYLLMVDYDFASDEATTYLTDDDLLDVAYSMGIPYEEVSMIYWG
jgi:hypothetical protein